MSFDSLTAFGWNERWAHLLSEVPGDPVPGRVVRHDGVALVVAGPDGIITAPLAERLDPEPTVGDWVAVVDGRPVAVLERSSLLRRRAAGRDAEQVLAANVDVVLLVCGLDRPVKAGRIRRGRDAGGRRRRPARHRAHQIDAGRESQRVVDRIGAANPGSR